MICLVAVAECQQLSDTNGLELSGSEGFHWAVSLALADDVDRVLIHATLIDHVGQSVLD